MKTSLLICQILANIFLPASARMAGPFYTVNEGFFPRIYNSSVMSYKTELIPMPKDYEDKRMYGSFEVKKTIRNLGAVFQVWKESAKNWMKRGTPTVFKNLCKMTYSTDTINKCFDGKMTESPTCTLEAGIYSLKNLTFEDDLRATVGKNMFYGRYKFTVTIKGTTDDGDDSGIVFEVIVWINDADLKTSTQVHNHPAPNKNSKPNHSNHPAKGRRSAG